VAAAVRAKSAISSILSDLLGMAYAAIATIIPSTRYLITRLINSATSNIRVIILNKEKNNFCTITFI